MVVGADAAPAQAVITSPPLVHTYYSWSSVEMCENSDGSRYIQKHICCRRKENGDAADWWLEYFVIQLWRLSAGWHSIGRYSACTADNSADYAGATDDRAAGAGADDGRSAYNSPTYAATLVYTSPFLPPGWSADSALRTAMK